LNKIDRCILQVDRSIDSTGECRLFFLLACRARFAAVRNLNDTSASCWLNDILPGEHLIKLPNLARLAQFVLVQVNLHVST
jgi:hypothetical protein